MSNTDSFIDEVSEEIRRDKFARILRKYGWIGVVLVILIVGGAAFNEYRKAQAQQAAQAYGDALLAALDSPTPDIALDEVTTPAEAAIVTALFQATESGEEGAQMLQDIASDPEAPDLYRDLARLRLVLLPDSGLSDTDRRAAIDILARDGGAFAQIGRELRALAMIEDGEIEPAIEELQQILAGPNVSQSLRQRASQLIVALGGELQQG